MMGCTDMTMRLLASTYDISGTEVTLRRLEDGRVEVVTGYSSFARSIEGDEEAWTTANMILRRIHGARHDNPPAANVYDHEIRELASIISSHGESK